MTKAREEYIIEALQQQIMDLQVKLVNLYADAKTKIDELERAAKKNAPVGE